MKNKIGICAIAKNEDIYLTEWVAYHKLLGFEIIIADNGGNDETSLILQKLHSNNIIHRVDFIGYQAPQIPAYRALARYAKKLKLDIIMFLDIDEFFSSSFPPKAINRENGVDHVGRLFSEHRLSQLSLHWVCYGSESNENDITKPVLERFNYHANSNEMWNVNIKSFVKINEYFTFLNLFYKGPPIFSAHFLPSANKRWMIDDQLYKKINYEKKISYNNGCILHYQIKTWIEYQRKIQRGDVAFAVNKNNLEYFQRHDYKQEKTKLPDSILNELAMEINRLNQLSIDYNNNTNIDAISLSSGSSKVGDQNKRKFRKLMRVKNFFNL